jgi:hypothetical protein
MTQAYLETQDIHKPAIAHNFLTALRAQTQAKKNFESVALQRFQNFSCDSFDRQLL